jgi:Zn finger protein HypA/HybF involved in hydrogenase expression
MKAKQPKLVLITCHTCEENLVWTLPNADVFCPTCQTWISQQIDADRSVNTHICI